MSARRIRNRREDASNVRTRCSWCARSASAPIPRPPPPTRSSSSTDPRIPGVGERARAEFEQVGRALISEGVNVCAVEDSAPPAKPDAVFPNNWLSFHEDGTLVLYPMHSMSRRCERRQEVIDGAIQECGFRVRHFLDLTHFEDQGMFLEGTGSLVLDHVQRARVRLPVAAHAPGRV